MKKESERVFHAIGMNMTTAFTVFLRQTVREQAIPFQLSAKEKRNLEYLKKLEDSAEELESGKGVVFTLDELEAFETMSANEARSFIEMRKAKRAEV